MKEPPGARADPGDDRASGSTPTPRAGRARSLLLGLALLSIYLGNRRTTIRTYDTFPNEWLPYALIRGEGPFLDRFGFALVLPGSEMADFATISRRHIVSRHPIGVALLAVPLTLPQVWYLDRSVPGWDRRADGLLWYCRRMAKNASAVMGALVGVALFRLLYRLGLGRVALPTVLAATLGSDLWTVASQAPWQHGPAALALTSIIALLIPRPASRARLIMAGLATALLVAIRPIDVVFAAIAVLWLIRSQPKGLAWFLPPAAAIAVALLVYNLRYFETPWGGQVELEALHPAVHGVRGVWTGDLAGGLAGTLLSPGRGLFVYTPWVALALLTLPATARRIGRYSILAWMLWGLVPYTFMLSKYSVWWAGHTFGPRYWIDVVPLFAIILGFALERARSRRPLLVLFAIAILWSIAVQVIGAFCYPSTWNWMPANVDRHHERLWDWRDNELARCLIEGRQPW